MRSYRVRLTTRRLMVLVGLLAVAFALIRIHPALAALAAGILGLAFLRTCEKLDRARDAGLPMPMWEAIRTGLASFLVGNALIVGPLVPVLCLVQFFIVMGSPAEMFFGFLILLFVIVSLASFLKRLLW